MAFCTAPPSLPLSPLSLALYGARLAQAWGAMEQLLREAVLTAPRVRGRGLRARVPLHKVAAAARAGARRQRGFNDRRLQAQAMVHDLTIAAREDDLLLPGDGPSCSSGSGGWRRLLPRQLLRLAFEQLGDGYRTCAKRIRASHCTVRKARAALANMLHERQREATRCCMRDMAWARGLSCCRIINSNCLLLAGSGSWRERAGWQQRCLWLGEGPQIAVLIRKPKEDVAFAHVGMGPLNLDADGEAKRYLY